MGWAPHITSRRKILDAAYAPERALTFVNMAGPHIISAERGRIRTLDWTPPAKIRLSACMWGANRPIEAIGNQALLKRLRLHEMVKAENARLAVRVDAIANLCTSAMVHHFRKGAGL